MNRPAITMPEKPDILEHGAAKPDGTPQVADERLFMQLLVLTGCQDTAPLIKAIVDQQLDAVLYADLHDPRGVGLLTWSGDPRYFVDRLRPALHSTAFSKLQLKPEMTMLGRTYALGHEADLTDWLFTKPRKTALNPDWPWAIWYPLRRRGSFMALTPEQQRQILMEHGRVGMSYVMHDLVHDIRLACHGLDTSDNDFVLGLIGSRLAPLSKIVEAMRKTTQTSQYIEKLGPFFVGQAIYQSGV